VGVGSVRGEILVGDLRILRSARAAGLPAVRDRHRRVREVRSLCRGGRCRPCRRIGAAVRDHSSRPGTDPTCGAVGGGSRGRSRERTGRDLQLGVTRFWDPDYYRTYSERPSDPAGYMSVEAEVARALENPGDFCNVPADSPHWRTQTSGLARDTATDSRPAFVVDDGTYISARWPGDTHTFAAAVSAKLHQKP
jgi:hypothetical protein